MLIDEVVAGISSIIHGNLSGWQSRKNQCCLRAFRCVGRSHSAGHRDVAEHVNGSGYKALGKMTFSAMLKAAVRVEHRPQFLGRGQRVLGTVDGIDGHAVPEVFVAGTKLGKGQIYTAMEHFFKGRPTDMRTSFGYGTAVQSVAAFPQAASSCATKEFIDLGLNSGRFASRSQGKNSCNQSWIGELALTLECTRVEQMTRINLLGNKSPKALKCKGCLA